MTTDVIIRGVLLPDSPPVGKTRTDLQLPLTIPQPPPVKLSQVLTPVETWKAPALVDAEQLPQPEQFPFLHETKGAMELTLPFGYEHGQVNAVTFKALAGRPADTLLRQHRGRWQIVDNAELIDLSDRSVLYKLGPVQIYS